MRFFFQFIYDSLHIILTYRRYLNNYHSFILLKNKKYYPTIKLKSFTRQHYLIFRMK